VTTRAKHANRVRPDQLPAGRHNLPRSVVEANQLERILDAVLDVASLTGYAAMTVEEIIGTAGVSRRTFYDHFKNKDQAFMAAVETVSEKLIVRLKETIDASETFADAVRDALGVLLRFFAEEPRYADLLVVEVLAAGPNGIAARNQVLKAFADMIDHASKRHPTTRQPSSLAVETIIGGIYEVVFARVIQGQTAELPALLPDLAYALMQPYLGDAAAKRESAKAPRAAPARAAAA
jgi:AcrR family transcriptional regulator